MYSLKRIPSLSFAPCFSAISKSVIITTSVIVIFQASALRQARKNSLYVRSLPHSCPWKNTFRLMYRFLKMQRYHFSFEWEVVLAIVKLYINIFPKKTRKTKLSGDNYNNAGDKCSRIQIADPAAPAFRVKSHPCIFQAFRFK